MYFSALRLSGFKSFLEPVELEIASGLTGVVGPNGCGKSNLVEALRWVMGESSAKRMRGGEMDDVIFGGSDKRPARNLAQVSLVVEGVDHFAPVAVQQAEKVEVTRRIERGRGSDYRVNNKSVRAKDVALLFQDNGTGPHSASLVSQGRIGALIAAKPTERRMLLEEAAGTTGLHTRRHEAELRLKAAEANLQRVDDVMGTLEVQLNLLKKQARQASRYRNVNADILKQEAALLHIRWVDLKKDLNRANAAFAAADGCVAELMLKIAQFEGAKEGLNEALLPLRQAEMEQTAALQRVVIEREQIDAEMARVADATRAALARKIQSATDRDREHALAEDAKKAIMAIEVETELLQEAEKTVETTRNTLATEMEAALAARRIAEQKVSEVQQQLAQAEADIRAQERRVQDAQSRRTRAQQRLQQLKAERERLEQSRTSDLFVAAAQREASEAEAALASATSQIEQCEQARQQAEAALEHIRAQMRQQEGQVSGLRAEKQAIERVLAVSKQDFPAILQQVTAQKGYEQALSVAFGDELNVPADEKALIHWQTLPQIEALPALPEGVLPLSQFVAAPAALARRLAFIGVVDASLVTPTMIASLKAGQCLVTKEGAAWRWDGLVVKTGAPTVAAIQLQQRNRLAEIATALEPALCALDEAQKILATAQAAAAESIQSVRQAREQQNNALAQLTKARRAANEAEAALSAYAHKIAALDESQERAGLELTTIQAEIAELAQEQIDLPLLEGLRDSLSKLRIVQSHTQATAADIEASRRAFEREHEQRVQRLSTLTQDNARWQARAAGAGERMAELLARVREAETELQTLAALPEALQQKRAALAEKIAAAEQERKKAVEALATAEAAAKENDRQLKHVEGLMMEAREQRAAAQAHVGAVQQAQATLAERIAEKCQCAPEALRMVAGVAEDEDFPAVPLIEAKLEKLQREREALGAVNLRAEQEAEEQQAQIDLMVSEKADLIEAIAKLRSAISSLNREARERMMAAYGKVQTHFKDLFHKLFGGGTAELKLTETDDPLEAGLEIIASPPGKKLQNLSLLSGGEQALTSLALLFAVFLVNPSPICVLDEVDAPLDEANIDRFCSLLEHMAAEGKTRFLVITHQRLTMSRMDRLYGVTMMERGVSQLVSVDLSAAEQMRDSA